LLTHACAHTCTHTTHAHTTRAHTQHTYHRLYNLPEVMSAKKYLGVEGVSARFGTDPFFWNWAMWLMARLLPRSKLNDRDFVRWFANLSDPFVRAVDAAVGEAVVRAWSCWQSDWLL